MAAEPKATELADKVARLRNEVLPRKEKALKAVEEVSAELPVSAERTRKEIRAAGERILGGIRGYVQERLDEVDNLSATRCKTLDEQQEDVRKKIKAIKELVEVGEALKEDKELVARLTALLVDASFNETPRRHALLSFKAAEPRVVKCDAASLVGPVHQCDANYSKCHPVGETLKIGFVDERIGFVVQMRDIDGGIVDQDDIELGLNWAKAGAPLFEHLPPKVDIEYMGDGSGQYFLSFVPVDIGEHVLEVFLDEKRMSFELTARIMGWKFSRDNLHPELVLGDDELSVTHTEKMSYSFAFGAKSFRTGRHSWMFSIQMPFNEIEDHLFGVVTREMYEKHADNQYQLRYVTYRWNNCGDRYHDGRRMSNELSQFEDGDMLRVDLDCDAHTIDMTNLRSGEKDQVYNLPVDAEFIPLVCTYFPGSGFKMDC